MKASSIIALDVGEKRIGIARAQAVVGFPTPLLTLINDAQIWDNLKQIVQDNQVEKVVVGLPRSLSGNETDQTRFTRNFIDQLEAHLKVEVITQDAALTSHKAEEELKARKTPYQKSDIDALAATYILEDYLSDQRMNVQ